MSYRVEELPPQTWHFRDQFSAALRARAARHTLVQATFRVRARQAIEPQPLSIDVRQLDPGDYLLSVEVVGPAGERVLRSLPFTVPNRDRLP